MKIDLKGNIIAIFVLTCLPVFVFSQNNLLIQKDVYQGLSFKNIGSEITKVINTKTGVENTYLKFDGSNQYLYKSEIENIITDTKILISYRDNYIFSDKDTIYTYNLNERGASLVMTFYRDKSSRCEIFFGGDRQVCFDIEDLEIFDKYLIDSLNIIKSIQ